MTVRDDDIGSNQSAFREIERQRHRPDQSDNGDADDWNFNREPPPPHHRPQLTVEAWRQLKLPERDYLLEGVMCTTSRWIINGDTGIGKTLLGLELGFAIASAQPFLIWHGVRPARVMYLDGEMPAETMKERIEAAASIYGNVDLIAYNRDVMGPDDMPPLNTPAGQAWLWREIDAVKPDLIIFDSIMCLLIGPLSEEETWGPMKAFIRQLSSRRIAQIWLHHTGHDASRGFGTKTKEWEMDTVAMLSKGDDDDGPLTLHFPKARLRTPKTASLFKPQSIQRGEDGWTSGPGTIKGRAPTDHERKKQWFLQGYNALAAATIPEPGTGLRVVKIADIREHMKQHGFLATEGGKIPGRERMAFSRAREDMIQHNHFACDDENFWEVHPSANEACSIENDPPPAAPPPEIDLDSYVRLSPPIGIEPPGTVCEQCRSSDGDVYLYRCRGVVSHALHEACAKIFLCAEGVNGQAERAAERRRNRRAGDFHCDAAVTSWASSRVTSQCLYRHL